MCCVLEQSVQSWVLVTIVIPWLLLAVVTGICCCYAMKKGVYFGKCITHHYIFSLISVRVLQIF